MLDAAILAVFPAALLVAAWSDVTSFIIPNAVSLTLLGAFPLAVLLLGLPSEALAWHAGLGALVLLISMVLFALGAFGGGDAKLVAATALWLGPDALAWFVMVTSLAGGALAMTLLMFRRFPLPASLAERAWVLRLHCGTNGIPYGLAIAVGGLAAFAQTPWIALARHATG